VTLQEFATILKYVFHHPDDLVQWEVDIARLVSKDEQIHAGVNIYSYRYYSSVHKSITVSYDDNEYRVRHLMFGTSKVWLERLITIPTGSDPEKVKVVLYLPREEILQHQALLRRWLKSKRSVDYLRMKFLSV